MFNLDKIEILIFFFLLLVNLVAIELHSLIDDAKFKKYCAGEDNHAKDIRKLQHLNYTGRLPSFKHYCLFELCKLFLV